MLVIALAIVCRVAWSIVGTCDARFASFLFGPGAVLEYMKGALIGRGKRHSGHHPGPAVAIFALLALVLTLAVTGFMMGQGNEAIREVHEILLWATVGVVIVHVLGVTRHTTRYRENITASMIHGKKHAEPSDAIVSPRPIVAVLFLVIAGGWAVGLVLNDNAPTQTTRLPLIGTSLQLGENDNERGKGRGPDQR